MKKKFKIRVYVLGPNGFQRERVDQKYEIAVAPAENIDRALRDKDTAFYNVTADGLLIGDSVSFNNTINEWTVTRIK